MRLGSYPEKKFYRSLAPAASTRGLNYETLRNRSIPPPASLSSADADPIVKTTGWRTDEKRRPLTLQLGPDASLHQPSMHSRRCISLRLLTSTLRGDLVFGITRRTTRSVFGK